MQGRVTDLALLPQLLMILVPTANLDLYNVAQASPALELKLTYRQRLTVICQTADRLLYLRGGGGSRQCCKVGTRLAKVPRDLG